MTAPPAPGAPARDRFRLRHAVAVSWLIVGSIYAGELVDDPARHRGRQAAVRLFHPMDPARATVVPGHAVDRLPRPPSP